MGGDSGGGQRARAVGRLGPLLMRILAMKTTWLALAAMAVAVVGVVAASAWAGGCPVSAGRAPAAALTATDASSDVAAPGVEGAKGKAGKKGPQKAGRKAAGPKITGKITIDGKEYTVVLRPVGKAGEGKKQAGGAQKAKKGGKQGKKQAGGAKKANKGGKNGKKRPAVVTVNGTKYRVQIVDPAQAGKAKAGAKAGKKADAAKGGKKAGAAKAGKKGRGRK